MDLFNLNDMTNPFFSNIELQLTEGMLVITTYIYYFFVPLIQTCFEIFYFNMALNV